MPSLLRRATFASLTGAFWLSNIAFGTATASVEPELRSQQQNFVTTNGIHFELNGKPFYFQGTNFYRLSLIEKQTDTQVYDIMQQLMAKGIKVVRIWGFACGPSNARPMIKTVTKTALEYDEIALRRLDLTIDAARAAGIKVILPLVNYQPEYCTMGWWVKQITGKDDPQLFYTDPDVRAAFKRHLGAMLARGNTSYADRRSEYTTYAEDPTIMAVELANEPHTEDFYEGRHQIHSGDLLYHWVSEMSDFVRSIDPHHLIATGEEGYKTAPGTNEEARLHPWLSDGSKGADYARNLSLPNINFATVHAYPTHWDIPQADMLWFETNFLIDRADVAHGENKPVVLEEAGISSAENPALGYTRDPAHWVERLFKTAYEANYAGTMLWELVPTGSDEGDFVYDFSSPVATVIFAQADLMNRKSSN